MDEGARTGFRDRVKAFWIKVGAYLFWGVMTTLVNVAAFSFFRTLLDVPLLASNAGAWTLAVAFAFATNRAFVFGSRAKGLADATGEFARFVASRLFSGALDMALMFVGARILSFDELATKIAVNVVVVVVNYVTSSLVVFRRGTGAQGAAGEVR